MNAKRSCEWIEYLNLKASRTTVVNSKEGCERMNYLNAKKPKKVHMSMSGTMEVLSSDQSNFPC